MPSSTQRTSTYCMFPTRARPRVCPICWPARGTRCLPARQRPMATCQRSGCARWRWPLTCGCPRCPMCLPSPRPASKTWRFRGGAGVDGRGGRAARGGRPAQQRVRQGAQGPGHQTTVANHGSDRDRQHPGTVRRHGTRRHCALERGRGPKSSEARLTPMRITVIGAGNIGLAVAAHACHHGHDTTLWSPSGAGTAALAAGQPLRYAGAIEGQARPGVASDLPAAVRDADVVYIALPATAHAGVFKQLGQCLRDAQPVILSALSSVSALVLDRELAARGLRSNIAVFGSTPMTARRAPTPEVQVSALRTVLDMAALPVARGPAALALCTALFGQRFRINGDILAMSLANVNPIAHSALALCNITRMEHAEQWPQYHCITPYVSRLIETMDAERLTLAAAVGCTLGT